MIPAELVKRTVFYCQMSSECQIVNTELTVTMKSIICHVKHIVLHSSMYNLAFCMVANVYSAENVSKMMNLKATNRRSNK